MVYHGLLEYYVMKVCHGKTPLVCDSGSSGSYAGLLRPYTDAHGNARTHGHTAANCNSGPHVDTHTDGDAHPHPDAQAHSHRGSEHDQQFGRDCSAAHG